MTEKTITFTERELEAMIRKTMRETVGEVLTSLGIDTATPFEMQQDFAWLRAWRLSVNSAKKAGIWSIVGVIVSGLAGLVVLVMHK